MCVRWRGLAALLLVLALAACAGVKVEPWVPDVPVDYANGPATLHGGGGGGGHAPF